MQNDILAPTSMYANPPENISRHIIVTQKLVRIALSDRKGYELLRELCALGPRLSGSENTQRAIVWAEQQMKKTKIDRITLQPVMVPKWIRGNTESAEIVLSSRYKGKKLNIAALGGSVGTPLEGVSAPVLEVRSFDELKLKHNDALGKIIFFNAPMDKGESNPFTAYGKAVVQRINGATEAAKAGGIAAIVRSMTTKDDNNPHTGSLIYPENSSKIPAVAIGIEDADFLSAAIRTESSIKVRLKLSCKSESDVQSYNVIGDIIGSDYPDEIILIGGHFDCWDKGEGAHDDGGGCIQALEVLDLFRRLSIQPRRTIRCVFFMNEENGFRGAQEYAQYAKTSKERHVAVIESDRGVFTPRGFSVDTDSIMTANIQNWLPLLQQAGIEWVRKGRGGSDVSAIKNAQARIDFVPDNQRYFDFHHSMNDVFAAIHPVEMELGTAAMAILAYLISEEGLR